MVEYGSRIAEGFGQNIKSSLLRDIHKSYTMLKIHVRKFIHFMIYDKQGMFFSFWYTTVFLPVLSVASTYFSLLWAHIPLPERQANCHLDGAAVKKRQKPQKKAKREPDADRASENVESFRWGEGKKAPGKCEQGWVAESALINVRKPTPAPVSGAAVASKLLLLRHVC